MRKNTLGKGLEALMGAETSPLPQGHLTLPTGRLKPGAGQPRKNFNSESLEELANSIAEKGLIQPLIVRKKGSKYEIVAGERRWRAAQKAGLHEVPVIVREMADGEAVEVALIENIQREDLNPIEEALAYEKLTGEFQLTHEEISKRVGKSRAAITNQLRLLKLPDAARNALSSGEISTGHARAILGLAPGTDEKETVRRVVGNRMSVRQTESFVKKINLSAGGADGKSSETDIYLKQAERSIRDSLGTKVKIEGNRKKGRIIIRYSSAEELDRLSFEIAEKSPVPGEL